MAEIEKKPVKIVETILRDAHQSLIATRMTTDQMMPIVDKMDKVGYHAVECWGGATFDASLRFLKEDPWERLRKFRDGFKNTKLQMLFRGQNILGYRPYADDVVEYFVQPLQQLTRKKHMHRLQCLILLEMLIHWNTGLTLQRESKIWVLALSV